MDFFCFIDGIWIILSFRSNITSTACNDIQEIIALILLQVTGMRQTASRPVKGALMKTQDYIDLENKYVAPNYNPLDVVIEKGKGAWVWDVEGKKYLDFLAAYSALNQGYCNPDIFEAMVKQAKQVTLTSRAFRNNQLPQLAKKLCEMLDYEMMLPMNSGAEAVETALKVTRKYGYVKKGISHYDAEIIAMGNNFHGRTISIISFSTEDDYRKAFGPFTPGFKTVPYGDLEALKNAITPNTAGILLEPVQGEAGVIFPPENYLKTISDLCKEKDILLITDEIQSGLGRTGKMLASEWEGVKADIVCLGKALGAGYYPVSAIVSSKKILSLFNPGEHGSTFGGNPLGCAVALAALEVLEKDKLPQRALKLGEHLMSKLSVLKNNSLVKDIRGKGLWAAVELKPEAGGARRFCTKLMERGVLVKDTHHNTIRIAPVLTISQEDLDFGIDKIIKVVEEG